MPTLYFVYSMYLFYLERLLVAICLLPRTAESSHYKLPETAESHYLLPEKAVSHYLLYTNTDLSHWLYATFNSTLKEKWRKI